jgi:hypothetical protein
MERNLNGCERKVKKKLNKMENGKRKTENKENR